MLFDTHFHLDLSKNPEEMVKAIEREKIYTIAVTNLPELFFNTEKLCKGSKYIRPALGFHPELAANHKNQLDLFSQLIDKTRYVGEIGLDNLNKSVEDYNQQKRIFENIIAICAIKRNKILTIHSRNAETDVISIIGNNFPGKVILHWYSGSIKELERAVSYGFYFSVNSAMTQSVNGKKIIEKIPNDRILIETDGPFVTLNNKPCIPYDSSLIITSLLEIKANTFISKRDVNCFYSNFKQLLS